MNFLGSTDIANAIEQDVHGRAADDRIFDQDHTFAFQHFAQRRVLGGCLGLPGTATFDEGSSGVSIADQSFAAGNR